MKKVKPVVYMVIGFLIAFIWMRSAEAATTEGGAAIASSELSGAVISYSERLDDKWDIGLFVVGEQSFQKADGKVRIGVNAAIHAQRVVSWKRLEMGLGAAYWQNRNRLLGCHFTFSLSVRAYSPKERFFVTARHFSNAGSCSPNSGQDMFLFGWRF